MSKAADPLKRTLDQLRQSVIRIPILTLYASAFATVVYHQSFWSLRSAKIGAISAENRSPSSS